MQYWASHGPILAFQHGAHTILVYGTGPVSPLIAYLYWPGTVLPELARYRCHHWPSIGPVQACLLGNWFTACKFCFICYPKGTLS